MQIIAEQRIENGLLSETLKILNLPNCPYTKEILRILPKLRKNERKAKGKLFILFIPECQVTSDCNFGKATLLDKEGDFRT